MVEAPVGEVVWGQSKESPTWHHLHNFSARPCENCGLKADVSEHEATIEVLREELACQKDSAEFYYFSTILATALLIGTAAFGFVKRYKKKGEKKEAKEKKGKGKG